MSGGERGGGGLIPPTHGLQSVVVGVHLWLHGGLCRASKGGLSSRHGARYCVYPRGAARYMHPHCSKRPRSAYLRLKLRDQIFA